MKERIFQDREDFKTTIPEPKLEVFQSFDSGIVL